MPLGNRRGRHPERSELVDQPLGGDSVGPLVHSVQRRHPPRHQQPRDLLVRGDHQMLDQPMRFGLRDRLGRHHVPLTVELELRLGGLECQRRLRGPPLFERGGRRPRDLERRAPASRRSLAAVEDAVDAPVVEALVGADHRAVERAAADAGAVEHEFGRDGKAILPGDERARAPRECFGQHRLDRAGDVDARPAPIGLAIQQRARANVGGHVGDVHPYPARSVVVDRGRDRIIEVPRGHRVDGERRQRAQIATIGRPLGAVPRGERGRGHLASLVLDGGIEPAPQSPVDH